MMCGILYSPLASLSLIIRMASGVFIAEFHAMFAM